VGHLKEVLEEEVEHLTESLQHELDELKEAVAVPLKHKEPDPVVGMDAGTFMTTPASVGTDAVFKKRLENGEERFLYVLMHIDGDLQEYPIPFQRRSQGNQDFILFELFRRLGETNRYFVEFGFNCADWGGSGPNTHALFERGWRGLLLDADNSNANINLHRRFLYYSNIGQILSEFRVPKELDYLSCDMDSHDWFVMLGILQANYRPRVLSIEFNSNYFSPTHVNGTGIAAAELDPTYSRKQEPGESKFVFKQCAWGSSPEANLMLMTKYNYTLVAVTYLLDMFFVRNDVLPDNIIIPPATQLLLPVRDLLHEPAQPMDLNNIVDVEIILRGGSIDEAKQSFLKKIAL
jgi:hypothetical protein